jgi:hypothetical protein
MVNATAPARDQSSALAVHRKYRKFPTAEPAGVSVLSEKPLSPWLAGAVLEQEAPTMPL